MRVKSLDILGFKSFATKTSVHFEPGVTALVGPNGSGKCVHGSSRVVLADGRVVRIDELVDAALQQSARAEQWDDGWCTYENPQGLAVLSVNPISLKLESRPISAFIKRASPETLYRFVTKTGRELIATGYHPLFTLEDGRLKAVPADQLKPGVRIAVPRRLPVTGTSDKLDNGAVMQRFDRLDSIYVPHSPELEQWIDGISAQAGGLAAASRAAGVQSIHIRTIRDKQALNIATVSRFGAQTCSMDEPWAASILQSSRSRKAAITVPTQLTPALARLLGYCISEGRVTSADQVWFVNSDPGLVEDFCQCVTEVFGLRARVLTYKPCAKDVIVFSHALCQYLEKAFQLAIGQLSAQKQAPACAFHASDECVKAFLSALFEGDGHLAVKRNGRRQIAYVEYTTASRRLAEDVCLLLARFGILARIQMKWKAATNTVAKVRRPYFSVMVYGVEHLKTLAGILDFRGAKRSALERLREIDCAQNPNDDVLPGATRLVKDFIRQAHVSVKRVRKECPTLAAYYEQRCDATRPGIQRVLETVRRSGQWNGQVTESAERLQTLATSDLYWDEIVRIEPLPAEQWVYDLAVEGHHNFIANGIVAHNSNIVDSIRWVLGEHNPRDVRAPRLEDVIFNGTDTKAPLSMAEVTLTLSNEQGLLPIAFNEVQITRRVYRSGESECFINQAPCRLKDIQELLLGTGLGGGAYAIIAQGHIDMILSSKPEERRVVFEEASGIGRYLAKKQETLRRLDDVEQNLVRIADITAEVRRQVSALERAAMKARQYKTQWEQLKAWEIRLAAYEISQSETIRQELARKVEELTQQREIHDTKRQELLASLEACNAAVTAAQGQVQEKRTAMVQSSSAIEHHAAQQTLKTTWVEEMTQQRRQLAQELAQLDERATQLAQQVERFAGQRDLLAGQAQEFLAQRQQAAEAIAAFEQQLADGARRLDEQKADVFDVAAEATRQRNALAGLLLRIQQLEHQVARVQEQRRVSQQRIESLSQRQQQVEQEHAGLRQQQQALEGRLAAARQAAGRAQGQHRELTGRLNGLREQALKHRAQAQLLEDVWRRHEGFPDSIKAILASPGQGGEAIAGAGPPDGVIGLLADLLDPESGYEQAVEAALGPLASAIVVRDRQTLLSCQAFLTAQQLEGAIFLVVSDFSSASPGSGAGLAQVVRCADECRALLEPLLGAWNVTDDLARVAREAAAPQPGAAHQPRWVSRSGERWDGVSWQLGNGRSSQSRIGRKRQWEQVQGLAEVLEREIAAVQQSCQQAEAEWHGLVTQEEQLKRQADEWLSTAAKLDGQVSLAQHECKRAQEELQAQTLEYDEVSGQQHEALQARGQAEGAVSQAEARQQELDQALKALQAGQEHADRSKQQQAVLLAQIETSLSSLQQRRNEVASRLSELDGERGQATGQLEQKRAQDVERAGRMAELTAQLEEHRQQVAVLTEEQAKLQADVDQVAEILRQEERQRDQVMPNLLTVEQELFKATQGLSEQETQLAEGGFRRTRIVERLRDVYQIEEAQVLAEQSSQTPLTGEERQALSEQIEKLKAKLGTMGPVNLGSVEEYDELKHRQEFLQTQQQDLIKSRDDLKTSIQQINRTARQQFRDTFTKIHQEFVHYFTKLFGGGLAELILVDEEDVLESGIEIIARPPGKRPQSISLLSGGERALTAIALLFALFKVRPSPFCILDEIDAPLDEANVDRFTKALEEFLSLSQFILITHNKKTITKADCLYGVTMEQPGMSKIVSVKLTKGKRSAEVPTPVPA